MPTWDIRTAMIELAIPKSSRQLLPWLLQPPTRKHALVVVPQTWVIRRVDEQFRTISSRRWSSTGSRSPSVADLRAKSVRLHGVSHTPLTGEQRYLCVDASVTRCTSTHAPLVRRGSSLWGEPAEAMPGGGHRRRVRPSTGVSGTHVDAELRAKRDCGRALDHLSHVPLFEAADRHGDETTTWLCPVNLCGLCSRRCRREGARRLLRSFRNFLRQHCHRACRSPSRAIE